MNQCEPAEIQMSIGENIKAKREAHQVSQKMLAEVLGIAENTVASWEKGKNVPPSDKVVTMAKYFACSTDEILLDEDERDITHEMFALLRRFNELNDEMKPMARGIISSVLQSMELEDYFRGDRGKPR
ncbi:helix-turn-helix domain-containing protein [Pseudomonas iridis]|uniref:helix-turn-helix domain-containing protein n=1 Tax=Pseudomonas iridis TaxID=2710587 RepID=UPI0021BFBB27|nr:helix-turn-helix transcriptional regulator [Pseudomonas iridis]MCT8947071.1 helix-turn-helix domain-containing protein [Pseudomonas iridis]